MSESSKEEETGWGPSDNVYREAEWKKYEKEQEQKEQKQKEQKQREQKQREQKQKQQDQKRAEYWTDGDLDKLSDLLDEKENRTREYRTDGDANTWLDEQQKKGKQEKPSWLERKWDTFINNRLNPARTVTFKKSSNHSLWKKLQHTFYFFFGDLPSGSDKPLHQAGALDWLGGFFSKILLNKCFNLWNELVELAKEDAQAQGGDTGFMQQPWVMKSLMGLTLVVAVPLLILQAIVALALTIIVSPIVAVAHIFVGPSFTHESMGNNVSEITPARQSFWFNPSTWGMGAVLVFGLGLLMQAANPAVFGLAAASLGVIQGVFLGMAALLLTLSVLNFFREVVVSISRQAKYTHVESTKGVKLIDGPQQLPQDNLISYGLITKMLSYVADRGFWISRHPRVSVLVGGLGVLMLWFAVALTVAFFVGVPSDLFISHIFDFMSNVLVSLIQAMSHLSGLGFLGAPEAVLLPIAHVLSAIFFIAAPVLITDSILRYLYVREKFKMNGSTVEQMEGSLVEEPSLSCSAKKNLDNSPAPQPPPPKKVFHPIDSLPIDEYGKVFNQIAAKFSFEPK